MRRAPLLAASLGLSLLSACTVGPNYVVPKTADVNLPGAQGAFLGAGDAPVKQDPVPDDWWKLYDDPTLNGLIEEALKANTDLRVASANLGRAEAVSAEVDAATEFEVSTKASAERAQLSGENYLVMKQLPTMNLGDAGVRVSYQLDLFGKLRRASEAARADAEASADAVDLARVTVVADVARSYVEACSAGHELAVAQRGVDVQARTLGVTTRMVAAGRDSAVDLTRGRALVDQTRAAIPVFEARRRVALYRLAVLSGKPPTEFPKAVEACDAPPRLSQPIPVGDGAALLRRRPDVRQAERGLAAATARIGVATAALYPSVTLGLGAGSSGILGDLGGGSTNQWSFGSLISWTLPRGGEHARIRQANAGAEAALARFDGVVLGALRETESSLTVYARDLDRNAALRAARDEAGQANEQAQRLYRAGRSPYLAGLDAQRTLTGADAALAASDAQVASDQVTLFLALGGGWSGAKAPAKAAE